MLGKLLKYDLKWVYKLVLVFYFLAFFFAIVSRIFMNFNHSMLFNILYQVCCGITTGMLVSGLINSLMRSWVRFVRNIYKDESYLTHTLPVEKKTIFASKTLTSVICMFTTVLVAVVCLFICYYSRANLDALKTMLELAAISYNTTVIKFILVISIVFFLEMLFINLIGYVGIIIGHRFNHGKMAKSVIISFLLYIATQGLTLGAIFISALFNKDIMNIINTTNAIQTSAITNIMYISIFVYLVFIIFYYILGCKLFKKGVNID